MVSALVGSGPSDQDAAPKMLCGTRRRVQRLVRVNIELRVESFGTGPSIMRVLISSSSGAERWPTDSTLSL
eukprot:1148501-Pyramimonas_sp.AAC.1